MSKSVTKSEFLNKVVLVTGAGRGIGAATAKRFASHGARVVLTSRTKSEIDAVAREIEVNKGKALARTIDVSNEHDVEKLFQEIKQTFGPIDILVNNAAVVAVGEFTEIDVKTWDNVMAINLRGSFLCTREAFKQMKAAKRGGCIINMSSLGGVQGTEKFKGLSAYVVSKFGVVGLTESTAVEGREHGIYVNCVAPGAVDTAMLKQAAPFLKTNTTPEDIASVILDLCDEAVTKKVTGKVVQIHSNL